MELSKQLLHLSQHCQSMHQLKLIQSHLLRRDISNPLILSKLLLFAAVSPRGNLRYATLLFSHHHQHYGDTTAAAFFYNTLIRGYANTSTPSLSFSLFVSMRRRPIPPDQFTFTFLLKALARTAGSSHDGCCTAIHSQVVKFGCLGSDLHVHNALIHFYGCLALPLDAHQVFDEMPVKADAISWSGLLNAHIRGGDVESARDVFDRLIPKERRDVVSWTAMIAGYAKAGRPRDALQLFDEMPMPPDELTMLGLITACAAIGDLKTGQDLHSYVETSGLIYMVALRNSLIDMYAKCGCLHRARQVFDEMPLQNRSLITWNSMIWAYASHGKANEAITLFRQVRPDGVTNLAVLSACAHAGRVEEGRRLFDEMRRSGEGVGVEHYGCVVDMLGRAGMLDEALVVVDGMPFECNDKVWGALLGGCRIYGDVKIGEMAVARLMKLKPEEGGYFVMLSAIYVEAGRHSEAAGIRRSMDSRKATKTRGVSHNGG